MGSKSPDSFTAGSDLIATYDVEGVDGIFSGALTVTGNTAHTGSMSASSLSVGGHVGITGSTSMTGVLSASTATYGGDVTVTGSVSASSLSVTGHVGVSGSFQTGITGISLTADNAFSPVIVAASHAPAGTDYAYPGSLWILTTFSGAAGSTVANGCLYMNTSASGATGSTWTVLAALVAG